MGIIEMVSIEYKIGIILPQLAATLVYQKHIILSIGVKIAAPADMHYSKAPCAHEHYIKNAVCQYDIKNNKQFPTCPSCFFHRDEQYNPANQY
jgi:hypothetical protein